MLPFEPRLVIFDLDGTVVDTLPPTLRCFQEAVAPALGRTPSEQEILDRFGPADHHIIAAWVGETEAPAAVARLYDCYQRAYVGWGPFSGMVDLIRTLRERGVMTALFTGRGRPSTDAVLESMGLDGLFDAIVTGEEALPKPSPDGVQRILAVLGVRPEQAVYVGDAQKDMDSATGAGVVPVAALWASPEATELEQSAALRVQDVNELRDLLGVGDPPDQDSG